VLREFGVKDKSNYRFHHTKSKAKMQNKIVEKLRDYFEKRDEILMAFLFGSWAKGQEGVESDMDIAVYFKPKADIVEWEETGSYYETEKKYG